MFQNDIIVPDCKLCLGASSRRVGTDLDRHFPEVGGYRHWSTRSPDLPANSYFCSVVIRKSGNFAVRFPSLT